MCRIMVVAQNPILGGLLGLHLEQEGFNVETVNHCDEILNQIHDTPPDLVIVDLTLRDRNGSEICAQACNRHGVPLIILAAPGLSEHRIKTGPLTYRCVLIKPFSSEALLRNVRLALDGKQNASAA